MAESGPTRGAERHEAEINRWRSHPWLARVLRVVIFLALLTVMFIALKREVWAHLTEPPAEPERG